MQPELLEVLDRLAEGELLAEIAKDMGVKRTTLYMRFHADDLDAYTRAREEGLLARGERLRQMAAEPVERLPSGGIDAAAVSHRKLLIETEKWTLAKLHGSIFGEKTETKHTGSVEIVAKEQRDAAVAAASRADK